jgi:hypothetical protein
MIRSVIAAIGISRNIDFLHRRKILKVDGRDGRDSQNWEKNAPAGRFTCMDMGTPKIIWIEGK